MIRFCSYPATVHVAAGCGCARAVRAAVLHVAAADVDATYGAYVAAETNTSSNES